MYIASCHLQIGTVLFISFQFRCPVSFYCPIAMCRICNSTMLKRSCKGGNPCLVPDPRGKTFSMLVVDFLQMFFTRSKKSLYTSSLLGVSIMKEC